MKKQWTKLLLFFGLLLFFLPNRAFAGEWVQADGAMAQKQWIQWNGKSYYLGKSGAMAHNQCVDGYYLSYDGVWKHENENEVKSSGRIEDEVQGRGRRQKKNKQYDDYFDDEVNDVDDADA